MPKAAMDYSKTSIYKIVCNDLNIKDCYVGHTTDMTKRKYTHKNACNNEKNRLHNCKIYQIIRENGGWENWNMVLFEKFPCNDKYEACKREREVYEELGAKMNTKRPYTTQEERKEDLKQIKKQYREENKEEYKQYMKHYREENKEKIKQQEKQYRENHKQYYQEYSKQHNKQYREENKEKIKQQKKQYREENKEVIAEKKKQYYQEHKTEINEKHKQYCVDHKAEIAEYKKQYQEDHKKEIAEKRKEKIECEYCSKRLSKCSMSSHIKICKSKPVKE